MILSNCPITNGTNAKVIKECVMSKSNPLYKTYGGFHTGVDIETENVYSMYDGTVVNIGESENGYSVTIQTGSSLCICYRWFKNKPIVTVGATVSNKQLLGTVKKYVHVESYNQQVSDWPVRIRTKDWYKFNITSVFDGTYVQSISPTQSNTFYASDTNEISDYDSAMLDVITEDFIIEHSGNGEGKN